MRLRPGVDAAIDNLNHSTSEPSVHTMLLNPGAFRQLWYELWTDLNRNSDISALARIKADGFTYRGVEFKMRERAR